MYFVKHTKCTIPTCPFAKSICPSPKDYNYKKAQNFWLFFDKKEIVFSKKLKL